MDVRAQLDAVAKVAEEAGEIALSYFQTDRLETRAKSDRDVVTAADTEAEKHVVSRLMALFPEDGIVAEEGGEANPDSRRRWYVDPVDGTVNFSRGIPIWCVSLALFEDGRPRMGVIHDPVRGETFCAGEGAGAWCNGVPMSASHVTTPEQAILHITVDFENVAMREGVQDVQCLAQRVLRIRGIGSAALALAYVAAGRLEACLHRYAHTWDFGAGAILIREAGGFVSEMSGEAYGEHSTSIFGSGTSELHSSLLTMLNDGRRSLTVGPQARSHPTS